MKMVLYTQRVEIVESYQERRDCADQRIPLFLEICGYLPIPVPNDIKLIKDYIEELKPAGILLTGGNSLVKYGGTAKERDEVDWMFLQIATKNQIPVYGFCRGMQSILDYFGEELVSVKNHVAVRHNIKGEIAGTVNSYHNQACVKLKENSKLVVLAQTEDQVIEAVRHQKYPILGTMWHPERENVFRNEDIDRVKTLFQ